VKLDCGHPNGDTKYRLGGLKSAIFDQYVTISQMVQGRHILAIEG